MTAGNFHSVSLLRQPSNRGRAAMLLALVLAVGPGGTLLFHITKSLFAADVPESSDQSISIDVASDLSIAGEKKSCPDFDTESESQAVGWQSAPNWDLTQQANDAWMVVDRPADDAPSPVAEAPSPPPASLAGIAPVPESTPHSDGDTIQLVNDEQTMPVISPAARAFNDIPSPPRPDATFASEEASPAVVPPRDDLKETREDWQGWNEDYFVDVEAASEESEMPPAEAELAPVAPPADSPPTPAPAPAEDLTQETPAEDVPAESGTPEPLVADAFGDSSVPQDQVFMQAPTMMYPGQACGSGPHPRCGVHCNGEACCKDLHWNDSWLIPWEVFAQGEYIGPTRTPHVPEYRLRVDDQIEFVYRLTCEKTAEPYLINTGDTLRIESLTSETLNRDTLVQPDGTVSLPNLGQVLVAGRSIDEVRRDLEARYEEHVRNPAITVTPIELNTVLEELRATVDNRFGNGGQSRYATVTPEGTVQLPAIGSVPAHGLTLDELANEIRYRYAAIVHGLEVTPILAERAPHYVYVLGEVRVPGRFTMEGPTTLMQAVAMAGGWNVGANLTQVVVFRRDDCWRLMATKVGIRRPLYGKDPCPDGEMWLRDSDIVVVPKSPILVADEFIDLVFTRGIYGVIPFSTNLSYVRDLSGAAGAVVPIP